MQRQDFISLAFIFLSSLLPSTYIVYHFPTHLGDFRFRKGKHQYLTYTSSSINKKHHHSSQHKPQEVKAVSRWLVRSIPVNRITVCKCQVTYFLFLELGCSRSNDWKNTVILLFPLCQSLSLPYFFFARSLAKPKDFVHIFNSIYVINCLTSLVSTMTDVSKRLYQSLKQNKTK